MKTATMFLALHLLVLVVAPQANAAQLCGCKKNTTGRVNKITAGAFPTCNLVSQTLVCWNDSAAAGVTSVTAGNGLQAAPVNPIAGSGTVSVNAPICSATGDKLLWDGSAFQCGVDGGGVLSNNLVVVTGTVSHGGTIPLPAGYSNSEVQCFVSLNDVGVASGGDGDNIERIQCSVDANRQVTAQVYVRNNFYRTGTANYLCIGMK